ncbi:Anthranilate 1,2-dioxygenase large subunit [Pseudoruegeria aquimaris]|uniref:Anthranilate 1,2-dioxygenase large subunit n=1 Tax=Pseudoruegeria aquimaris TaxID=393663 RepID=A0A1Y5SV70_9RHOB|nr:aromatic ring-hydroxylating dioxygenase subunit alpha [Pseudoruegeria aquimaris]SLN48586.1 Anthranilate 1,2-dioxygenase large subunit [Pseudoruegeria aquimaris]
MQHVATTDLEAVLKEVSKARGLPNAHYVSPEIFEEERQAVLFDNWAGVGFGADVPEPGDVMPVDFLGMPLLLARDREGRLHVYQNTCRHRGMILVEEKRKVEGALRCPYHSWCYALTGELRATPHVGGPGHNTHPDVDKGDLGLTRVRHHLWRDVIFVNVSGTAAPFEEVHADLLARWAEFEHPVVPGGADSRFELDVATNWKLAVENYCESYHLPWVHPGLNSYSRLEDHYHIEAPGAYSGQGTLVYQQLRREGQPRFPDVPGLGAKWETAAEYVALYPNVLLGVHRDHSFAILLQPLSTERTIEHVALYYTAPEAAGPDYAEMRAENARLWKGVFEEDVFVVEGMQRGRHGVLFDGGRFSPAMDGPTHLFHHWVASQLLRRRAGAV